MTTVRAPFFLHRELAPIAAITLWFLVMSQGCDTGSGQNVSELVKDLKDKRADVRRDAADALVRIGPEAKAVVPALSEALKDEDRNVRRSKNKPKRLPHHHRQAPGCQQGLQRTPIQKPNKSLFGLV